MGYDLQALFGTKDSMGSPVDHSYLSKKELEFEILKKSKPTHINFLVIIRIMLNCKVGHKGRYRTGNTIQNNFDVSAIMNVSDLGIGLASMGIM